MAATRRVWFSGCRSSAIIAIWRCLVCPRRKQAAPVLTAFEKRLAMLTREIAGRLTEDAKLLEELSGLSADLAKVTAETRYRMSATRAYAHLVSDRLCELDVTRIPAIKRWSISLSDD